MVAGTAAPQEGWPRFTEREWADLPSPVVRYLRGAIAPGTPLATQAVLAMRGRIKLGGRWLPFRANQQLAPGDAFLWSARVAGVITGHDRYAAGRGELRWHLLGVLPVLRADGPDVSRSAAGRAAAEAVWLPSALLPSRGVRWSAADDRHVTATLDVHGNRIDLRYTLDPRGRPLSTVLDRWGDPDGSGTFGLHPFGMEPTAFADFGGFTIPCAGRAGWFPSSSRWSAGEFFRYEITALKPGARPSR